MNLNDSNDKNTHSLNDGDENHSESNNDTNTAAANSNDNEDNHDNTVTDARDIHDRISAVAAAVEAPCANINVNMNSINRKRHNKSSSSSSSFIKIRALNPSLNLADNCVIECLEKVVASFFFYKGIKRLTRLKLRNCALQIFVFIYAVGRETRRQAAISRRAQSNVFDLFAALAIVNGSLYKRLVDSLNGVRNNDFSNSSSSSSSLTRNRKRFIVNELSDCSEYCSVDDDDDDDDNDDNDCHNRSNVENHAQRLIRETNKNGDYPLSCEFKDLVEVKNFTLDLDDESNCDDCQQADEAKAAAARLEASKKFSFGSSFIPRLPTTKMYAAVEIADNTGMHNSSGGSSTAAYAQQQAPQTETRFRRKLEASLNAQLLLPKLMQSAPLLRESGELNRISNQTINKQWSSNRQQSSKQQGNNEKSNLFLNCNYNKN